MLQKDSEDSKETKKTKFGFWKSKYYFGVKSRLAVLICPMIMLLIVAFVFFQKAINYVDVYQLFYTENSNLDYVVCLKENEYFSEKCLDKDNLYIANIIDYINTEFKYTLNVSDMIDYRYKYSITANLSAVERGGNSSKKLYSKNEEILPEKSGTESNNIFIIDEKVKIDYNKYNSLMTAFKKDYILLLVSDLTVVLNIELEGKYKNIEEPIKINEEITLTVPLSEQTLNIGVEYENINKQEMVEMSVKDQTIIYIYYGIIGIALLIFVFLLIKLLLLLKKIVIPKSNYTKKLNKILREYNQVIATTKKLPDVSDYKIIELKNFEELLDIRETLLKPIIYTEINSVKSWFMIINDGEMYRFVLKEADL